MNKRLNPFREAYSESCQNYFSESESDSESNEEKCTEFLESAIEDMLEDGKYFKEDVIGNIAKKGEVTAYWTTFFSKPDAVDNAKVEPHFKEYTEKIFSFVAEEISRRFSYYILEDQVIEVKDDAKEYENDAPKAPNVMDNIKSPIGPDRDAPANP